MNKSFVIFAAFVFFISACGKKETARQPARPAQQQQEPARQAFTPKQCVEQSVFGVGTFQNDCMGLKFSGGLPFLYGAQKIYGPTVSFAVPTGGFAVKIIVFENPSKGIDDEISRLNFSKSMRDYLTAAPGAVIIQENVTEINNIPVLYFETANGANIARNYFFRNRGHWAQLTISFTKESFAVNPSAQNQFIKSINLY